MFARLSEIVHEWMGWCPNAQPHTQRGTSEQVGMAITSSQRRSFKARAIDWLGLFRNQMFLLAIWFSGVGCLLLLILGNTNVVMFFWGLLAGLLLSVFLGIRFWGTMNDVLENGSVFLSTLYDKTTIFISLLACSVPLLLSLGASPVANMMMWNAVIAGLVFITFWVQLFVVWIWETRVDRHLQSDGLMLSLAQGN